MTWSDERLPSDPVCQAPSPTEVVSAPSHATAMERLVDPRPMGIGPAGLVSCMDRAIQDAMEDVPHVLWQSEEVVRFELQGTRFLLLLSADHGTSAQAMTVVVQYAGPREEEVATSLARFIALRLMQRYPTLHSAAVPALGDPDLVELVAEPLPQPMPGLPPIESLEEQVWYRDSARAMPRPAPAVPAKGLLQRLRRAFAPVQVPTLRPMRPAVRALALGLFVFGLAQAPMNQQAEASTHRTSAP